MKKYIPTRWGIFLILVFWVIIPLSPLQAQHRIMTLKEALSLAQSENSLAAQLEYAREAAQQDILLQQTNYWPTLQFRANVSHANEAPRIPVEFENDTVLARQGTKDTFISRFELDQMVYDFGKTRYSVEAARWQARSIDAQFDQQLADLRTQIRGLFYQSIYFQKLDSLYAEVIPFAKELAQISDVRLQNGVALAPEFLKAQVDLQDLQAKQTTAQNEYRKTLVHLAQLTGQPKVDFDTRGKLPELFRQEITSELYPQLRQLSLEHRSDIDQLAYRSEQQTALSKSIQALRYPTLMLQSDFSYFGPDAFGYYSGLSSRGLNPLNWRVGIGFTYTLFDGYRIRREKSRAVALQKQYREQAMQLEDQTAAQIQMLLTDLENLKTLAYTNRLLISQIEASIATTRTSFESGNISRLDYIKAVIPKVTAEAALQKTRYDIAQTLVQLEKTVGTDITQVWK